ncbi:MAG: DUF924 domain-containing protein [Deltaproteobacteria bacterium]|nr:DUF924 domain-containing protein [Deltaproteobacteria bacterium]
MTDSSNADDDRTTVPPEAEEVLSFWFGALDAEGRASEATAARWFKKDPAFDQELRDRFGALHAAILAGEREDWLDGVRGSLAYVIVLDQFPRNMFRDTPGMFASDEQALRVALAAIETGGERALALAERTFLYMPLMHSEELHIQDRCVELFAAFRDELDGESRQRVGQNHTFAEKHRDIIARWGRFPHRNGILGRESTPAEVEFLSLPGSSF